LKVQKLELVMVPVKKALLAITLATIMINTALSQAVVAQPGDQSLAQVTDPAAYFSRVQAQLLERKEGGVPFHIQGHFTGYGTVESSGPGTYELTWISPRKWRSEITLGPFKQILVQKGDKTYRLTPDTYEPLAAREINSKLFPSFPKKNISGFNLQHVKLKGHEIVRIGTGEMKGDTISLPEHAWYFSGTTDHLLFTTDGDELTTYTRNGALSGLFAELDFNITQRHQKFLDFQTDKLSSDPEVDEAIFAPTATAEIVPVILPSSDVVRARIISRQDVVYPPFAQASAIYGLVLIEAVIDKSGAVREPRILESPNPLLSDSALTAVKKWTYSPTMLGGTPVATDLRIEVNFPPHR
jgi:TonB family protein